MNTEVTTLLALLDEARVYLSRIFPGMHLVTNDRYIPLDEVPEGVDSGKCQRVKVILVKDIATLTVDVLSAQMVITFRCFQDEQVKRLTLSDLPQATEDEGSYDSKMRLKKARGKAIADVAYEMANPTLRNLWSTHRASVIRFSKVGSTAAALADFYGDRVAFNYVEGCGPPQRFKIIMDGGGGGAWLGDVPPVDGQECWYVGAERSPTISIARLRRNDKYDHGRSGNRIFIVDEVSSRPVFVAGQLLKPEGKLKEAHYFGGVLIPRNPMTDRMAKLATVALNQLDSATAKNAIIKEAFGDVLLSTTERVEKAAERVEKATSRT